ncbi:hypothetical protein BT63DRAFT_483327 [Microthyrium microscopicum]|uniref:Integral membrane protein n=1 Tax=Microthyrium microscopicum TaxID=703497 RepID=A0A6A6TY56_9PEZI|nr:hypothetical protein BT63DRAFT_483327 [Microthyrium microscopicum]
MAIFSKSKSNTQEKHDTGNGTVSRKQSHVTRNVSLISAFLFFIAVIFLILVEVGSTSVGPTLSSIYFLKLDLSQIVPATIPDAVLLNTIAQSIGLHDYYSVGLWNFCEGYVGQGITTCSKPETLYWFDPVSIILNELLAGATIAIPTQVVTYLTILKVASQVMFGLFLTGLLLDFLMVITIPFSMRNGWLQCFITIFSLLAALCTTVAALIATAIFVIITKAATGVTELHIGATIGKKMFAFMWIASACTLIAWLLQTSVCCCCRKRRRREHPKKRDMVENKV